MRRRPVAGILPDQMEKSAAKTQTSRICFLAVLTAFFWLLLLYFHFIILPQQDQHQATITATVNHQLIPLNHQPPPYSPPPPPQSKTPPRKNFGFPDKSTPQQQSQTPPKSNFPFTKALATSTNKTDPCGGRYIYVHDLPSRFNQDMLRDCKTLSLWTNMCKFTTNAGLGPPLENIDGVFSDKGWIHRDFDVAHTLMLLPTS